MTFIPYQIDYGVQNTAKTLGFSKKRVLFKFGLANPQAVRNGLAGAQCRGSEHEVTFLWSLKSGKRQLYLDGKDVHFSESGQNGWTVDRAWQHVFTMRDPTGTYRLHFISQPKLPDMPDSRPFDLRVAGISFFSFNKIYQLGTPAMVVRDNGGASGSGTSAYGRSSADQDEPMSPEERRMLAQARVESMREFQQQQLKQQQQRSSRTTSGSSQQTPQQTALPRDEPLLLSFDDPSPPPAAAPSNSLLTAGAAPPPQPYAPSSSLSYYAPHNHMSMASSVTLDPALHSVGSFDTAYTSPSLPQQQQQQQQQQQYGQAPPSGMTYGQPPPPPPAPAPFAYGGASPYGPPQSQQQQQQQHSMTSAYGGPSSYAGPPAFGTAPSVSSSSSTTGALTPYQPPPGVAAPSPYAQNNPTPAPAPAMSSSSYYGEMNGATSTFGTGAGGDAAGPYGQQPPPPSQQPGMMMMMSPGAQSYQSYGSASYGSAPSFAQPPRASLANSALAAAPPPPPPSAYQQPAPPGYPVVASNYSGSGDGYGAGSVHSSLYAVGGGDAPNANQSLATTGGSGMPPPAAGGGYYQPPQQQQQQQQQPQQPTYYY